LVRKYGAYPPAKTKSSKDDEKEYQPYGQNVPFIFPVPHHTEIPELLSSMVIALVTGVLSTFL